MPEPTQVADPAQVRVRFPNGALKTLPAGHPATEGDDVEVLHDEPAVDDYGTTLPTVYPPADAPKEVRSVEGYNALSIPVLKDLIDERNEGRESSQEISKSGNKPVLVAALEADDAAQAAIGAGGTPDSPVQGETDQSQEA